MMAASKQGHLRPHCTSKARLVKGYEMNFFMQAPSGDWKIFFSRQMKKFGRQKVAHKIFVS